MTEKEWENDWVQFKISFRWAKKIWLNRGLNLRPPVKAVSTCDPHDCRFPGLQWFIVHWMEAVLLLIFFFVNFLLFCSVFLFGASVQKVFKDLWMKYGAIYSLKFLGQDVVVLNSIHVVKEALVKKAVDFAGRPNTYSGMCCCDCLNPFPFPSSMFYQCLYKPWLEWKGLFIFPCLGCWCFTLIAYRTPRSSMLDKCPNSFRVCPETWLSPRYSNHTTSW